MAPWNYQTWAKIAHDRFGLNPAPPGNPWTPPTAPPPGTYDPSLDFQGENAQLGYGYSQQDQAQGLGRAGQDYRTALNTGLGQHQSLLDALGLSQTRANQDYTSNTQALGRSYTNLANNQGQRAAAAGASDSGAGLQAGQKRAANQSIDQGKLDQAIQRFREDNQTRVGQENTRWTDLVGADGQGGSLGQAYQRQVQDLNTGGDRAFTENQSFLDQLGRAKTYGAEQAGLLPTLPQGAYAQLPAGQASHLFGGVEYGSSGDPYNPFLAPTTRPTAQSVISTGSLLGTRLDPGRYRKLRRY